jgi:hypothetical protein
MHFQENNEVEPIFIASNNQDYSNYMSDTHITFIPLLDYNNLHSFNNEELDIFHDIRANVLSSITASTEYKEPTVEEIETVKENYGIHTLNEHIVTFKTKVLDLYKRSQFHDLNYISALKKYEKFSIDLLNAIKTIKENLEENVTLTQMITNKITEYYKKLEIEQLRERYLRSLQEIDIIKGTLVTLNSIHKTNVCPICLDNSVEYFIDPCGHTMCKRCKDISTLRKCFYCRSHVLSIKKLFLMEPL